MVNNTYKDPLHIPSEKLLVYFNNKPILMLNKHLLDQQLAWNNLEEIKETHWLKAMFNEMIENTNNPTEIKELAKNLTECEFHLQELWGFPKDIKFHRFWEYNKCSCPKMDNEDSYATGYQIINVDCVLHGDSHLHTKLGKEIF